MVIKEGSSYVNEKGSVMDPHWFTGVSPTLLNWEPLADSPASKTQNECRRGSI